MAQIVVIGTIDTRLLRRVMVQVVLLQIVVIVLLLQTQLVLLLVLLVLLHQLLMLTKVEIQRAIHTEFVLDDFIHVAVLKPAL